MTTPRAPSQLTLIGKRAMFNVVLVIEPKRGKNRRELVTGFPEIDKAQLYARQSVEAAITSANPIVRADVCNADGVLWSINDRGAIWAIGEGA